MEMDIVKGLGVVAVIIVFLLVGILWLSSASCNAQTAEIGMEHKWGILSDCMVKDNKTGNWIPLSNYRKI